MQSSRDMSINFRFLFSVLSCGLLMLTPSFAVSLQGTASVSITSDTASAAKNIAFDEARRQIIRDALRQYADVDALGAAVKNAKSAELTNLIAQSSIDGEQTSDVMYSAKISMVLDDVAAREWLVANDVNHWLPNANEQNMFVVSVNMTDALPQWAELNKIARDENLDLGTKNIVGNTAVLELPVASRSVFTIALREAGWRYSDADGVLRIWK